VLLMGQPEPRNGELETMKPFAILVAVIAAVSSVACASGDDPASQTATGKSALTAEQCSYFAADGKITLCHATSSAKHPYTVLKVSESACIESLAKNPNDYVAVNDPTCNGGGCLPEAAPCDATVPCCEGLSCDSGKCVKPAKDPCTCGYGMCFVPPNPDGSDPCANSANPQCQVGAWAADWCDTGAACMAGIALWCADPGVQWHFPR